MAVIVNSFLPAVQINNFLKDYAENTLSVLSDSQLAYISASYFLTNQSKLKEINLPNCSFISGLGVFSNCTSLTSINLPNCKSLRQAFSKCTALNVLDLPECTYISEAFVACSNLSVISLPKCISIASNAFSGASHLTTLYLPSCKDINGQSTFQGYNLSTLCLPCCIYITGFNRAANIEILENPVVLTIRGFDQCSKLATVSLDNLTFISGAFCGSCSNLETIYLPKLQRISGGSQFTSPNKITSLDFPECIEISGAAGIYGALSSMQLLKTISLPKCSKLTSALYRCISLESVYLMGSSICSINNTTFSSTPIRNSSYLGHFGSVFVPASLYNSYIVAQYWSAISARIVSV